MSFSWPLALLSLLSVLLLLGVYLWQLRRKRRVAVRYSSVALIRAAMSTHSRWRRHLPVALFLVGLAGLCIASARPKAMIAVPLNRTSVILALDVSGSMCSTDVKPNRLTVAQAAARSFVEKQPSGVRVGLVAFSGFAELVVPPTTERKQVIEAIDNLTTARGTAIGAAALKSVDAIASINADVSPITTEESYGAVTAPAPPATAKEYVPDIVVVLTDGRNTPGDRTPRGGQGRRPPTSARVHDRIRHDEARAPPCARGSSLAVTRSVAEVSAAAAAAASAAAVRSGPRRGRRDAEEPGTGDRRPVLQSKGCRPARAGVRRASATRRTTEAAGRDQRCIRRVRSALTGAAMLLSLLWNRAP